MEWKDQPEVIVKVSRETAKIMERKLEEASKQKEMDGDDESRGRCFKRVHALFNPMINHSEVFRCDLSVFIDIG